MAKPCVCTIEAIDQTTVCCHGHRAAQGVKGSNWLFVLQEVVASRFYPRPPPPPPMNEAPPEGSSPGRKEDHHSEPTSEPPEMALVPATTGTGTGADHGRVAAAAAGSPGTGEAKAGHDDPPVDWFEPLEDDDDTHGQELHDPGPLQQQEQQHTNRRAEEEEAGGGGGGVGGEEEKAAWPEKVRKAGVWRATRGCLRGFIGRSALSPSDG